MGTAALQKTTVLAVKGRRETFLICWFYAISLRLRQHMSINQSRKDRDI